ncbi:MAG: hypothetical protein QGD96_03975 [Anaerolineae bacterium]|nr:hypothetical protein [Anaerolineae bacterium]
MRKRLYQLLRIRPGEARLVFGLGAILFINDATMGISRVVSVSGFLREVQDYYILLVWAVDMCLLILATGLQSLIIDRYNRIKLLGGIILILAGAYALLPYTFAIDGFPLEISYTLLYLLTDQQWLVFPIVFWILINDIFDPGQGRRLIPVIGTFAFLGAIVGLGIAHLDVTVNFGTTNLLLFNAGLFVLAWLLVVTVLRKAKIRQSSANMASFSEALSGGWEFIRAVPSFRFLSIGMFAAGVSLTVLLYDVLSDASLELGAGFQSFFALYSLAIAVSSVLIQFMSGKIIEKWGLKNSFLFLPFSMLIGSLVTFFVPGYWGSAAAQGVARVTVQTVDQSSRKAYQALVPDGKRGRVSIFIDSYLPSIGTIFGSLITFGIISLGISLSLTRQTYTSIYLGLAILGGVIGVITFFLMRSAYDKSLLNPLLKRRSRGASILDGLDFSDSGDND